MPLTISFSATATQGNFKDAISPGSKSVTLTTQGANMGVQQIGTTAEDLDYGDVAAANAGYLYLENLDSTNYVEYGLNDAGTIKKVGRLKPGEIAFFRVNPSAQVMMQANTGPVNVGFRLYRD